MKPSLTIGGLITCLIGLAHVFLPSIGYDSTIPHSMPPAVSAHFYYLGTYAICAFLLSFGFLSLYFSRNAQAPHTLVVCSIFALFWASRTALEILYPVNLSLFFLTTPHVVLLPVIAFLALTYTVAAFAGWWIKRKDATSHERRTTTT
jgi:hypothetical protein